MPTSEAIERTTRDVRRANIKNYDTIRTMGSSSPTKKKIIRCFHIKRHGFSSNSLPPKKRPMVASFVTTQPNRNPIDFIAISNYTTSHHTRGRGTKKLFASFATLVEFFSFSVQTATHSDNALSHRHHHRHLYSPTCHHLCVPLSGRDLNPACAAPK